jgi:hypothetical protein
MQVPELILDYAREEKWRLENATRAFSVELRVRGFVFVLSAVTAGSVEE